MNQVNLSLIILTHRRPSFIQRLLANLFKSLEEQKDFSYEVILSENPKENLTLPQKYKENLRRISPPKILETAEEHFFFAAEKAKGEYIWIIGDHDEIVVESIPTLINCIKKGEYDLICFDNKIGDSLGRVVSPFTTLAAGPINHISFKEFVRRTGFWFVSAGFAKIIFRKKEANLAIAKKYVNICKIYSHVCFLLHCFHNKRFIFINKPILISMSRSPCEEENGFKEFTKKAKTFRLFPWTLGFLRQLKKLQEEKIIDSKYLSEIVDQNSSGRFLLINLISHIIFEQIDSNSKQKINEQMKTSEFYECLEILEEAMPSKTFLWKSLEETWHASRGLRLREKRQIIRKNKKLFHSLLDIPFVLNYFTMFYGSLAVYDTPWGVYAVEPQKIQKLIYLSRRIDPEKWSNEPNNGLYWFKDMEVLQEKKLEKGNLLLTPYFIKLHKSRETDLINLSSDGSIRKISSYIKRRLKRLRENTNGLISAFFAND